jgi:hypothetical protein
VAETEPGQVAGSLQRLVPPTQAAAVEAVEPVEHLRTELVPLAAQA